MTKGIFVGPRIREVFKDPKFEKTINTLELKAWHAYEWICSNFLENFKSNSYREGVAEFLAAYKEMGRRMSLTMHFLHSHLEFCPENLEQLVMSRVKYFTKIFKLWKKGINEVGMKG